jgi:hypothetical protein
VSPWQLKPGALHCTMLTRSPQPPSWQPAGFGGATYVWSRISQVAKLVPSSRVNTSHAMFPDGDPKPPLACAGGGSAMVAATVAVAISASFVILMVVIDAFSLSFACRLPWSRERLFSSQAWLSPFSPRRSMITRLLEPHGVFRNTGMQPSSTARRGVDRSGGGVLADASPQQRAQEVLVVISRLGRVDEPFDDLDEAIRVVAKRHVPGVFEDL